MLSALILLLIFNFRFFCSVYNFSDFNYSCFYVGETVGEINLLILWHRVLSRSRLFVLVLL